MSNFSQQNHYSITLSNPINDTITINCDLTAEDAYSNYITIPSDYNIQYEIDFGKDWKTHFPDFETVTKMSKEYPALEKALEHFRTIYEIVKDDYENKVKNSTE